MAAFYIVGAIAILFINASEIPHAFGLIFGSAFSGHAAVGGFAGSTLMLALRNGVARGVFTSFNINGVKKLLENIRIM